MAIKAAPPAGAVTPAVQTAVRRLTRWVAALTVLVVGAWVAGGLLIFWYGAASDADRPGTANAKQRSSSTASATSSGPWGEIVYIPMMISPPMEFVPDYASFGPQEPVTWNFPNTTPAQLGDLLAQIGLPDELRSKLRSMAQLDPSINGLSLRPDRELVLGLGPEARAGLYIAMGFFTANPAQANAFRFRGTSLDEWFDDTEVAPATRKLIAPLVYRRGKYLFFADLQSIEGSLATEERLTLVKALSREATFLARLKITSDSDIDGLVSYWGRGGRDKDVRPILESLAGLEGGQTLNIEQLLPPFAQQRLYKYPPPPAKGAAEKHDCHWTAMNFFSEVPDDRFGVPAETTRVIQQDYYPVYGNLQLGDIVMFCADQTSAIHSAVYIADDILFTKNGNTSVRPWMLMKLDDMREFYPSSKPLTLRCYRRKGM